MNCIKNNFILSVLLFICLSSNTHAAIFDLEANGVYGGFWRDLYKFGPVVIDTVGGDLGVFVSNELKIGFSFATVAGLLSRNKDDDVLTQFQKVMELLIGTVVFSMLWNRLIFLTAQQHLNLSIFFMTVQHLVGQRQQTSDKGYSVKVRS